MNSLAYAFHSVKADLSKQDEQIYREIVQKEISFYDKDTKEPQKREIVDWMRNTFLKAPLSTEVNVDKNVEQLCFMFDFLPF